MSEELNYHRVTTTPYGDRLKKELADQIKRSKQFPKMIVTKDPTRHPTFEENVHAVFVELEELLLSKHHDYGPKNIAEAPGGPHNGLRVRLYDKLARLSNWFENGLSLKHETAEESYKDIANYGAIGLLVSRGQWPNA